MGDKSSPYDGKGFVVGSTPNGNYSLAFSGRLQLGTTAFVGNGTEQYYPNINSVRLIFTGNALNRDTYYMIQLGFGEQEQYFSPTPLVDTWVESRHIRWANVRFGTLDRHALRHSSSSNQLIMDSIVHYELDLFRDVGIRIHSDEPFGTNLVKYWIDVGSGKGLNYLQWQNVNTILCYGRVEVSPFGSFDSNKLGDLGRRRSPALALAVSAGYNHHAIFQLSDWIGPGMTPYQVPFNYKHGGADLIFKWRGFSLLGTALYRRATEWSHTVPESNSTEYSRNAWGWFSVAGIMLTERVEVASRMGALYQIAKPAALVATAPYLAEGYVQSDVANFRNLHEVATGVSYYLAKHAFKLQVDYARIFVGAFREGVHEVRTQLSIQL